MPTFDQLCLDQQCTSEEREALALHLATLRTKGTLKLAKPPITRAALAAAEFAKDGKVPVVRGGHVVREHPKQTVTLPANEWALIRRHLRDFAPLEHEDEFYAIAAKIKEQTKEQSAPASQSQETKNVDTSGSR